jgi:hypothetical protein
MFSPMEKTVILSFVLGLFFFAAPSLLNAQDTLAPPLVSETNTAIEQDSGSAVVKQTGGFYSAYICVGIPFMPKMTNFWGYGVQSGINIYKNSLFAQGFINLGGYVTNFGKSKLTHTMVFSGNNSSEVEVVYDTDVIFWGFGLKKITRKETSSRPFFEGNFGMVHIRNNFHLQSGGINYDALPDSWTRLNRDRAPIFNIGIGIELGKPEKQVAFYAGINYLRSFVPINYTHHQFMELEPRPSSQSGGTDVFVDFVGYEELPSNVYNHKVAELYRYPLQFLNFRIGLTFK